MFFIKLVAIYLVSRDPGLLSNSRTLFLCADMKLSPALCLLSLRFLASNTIALAKILESWVVVQSISLYISLFSFVLSDAVLYNSMKVLF